MAFMDDFEHLKIQLKDIKLATNDFGDKPIGMGGFGRVYKGELSLPEGKKLVAIKRLDRKHGQGDIEFWKEIMMLSQYKHENLISLLHFCNEDGERILVYEYAPGGSLDLYLGKTSLTWSQLLNICHGVACGLNYLHDPMNSQQRILHRDVKSSNILLDDKFNAKISDFGLSKIGPANQQYTYLVSNIVGTPGYCDPMYLETAQIGSRGSCNFCGSQMNPPLYSYAPYISLDTNFFILASPRFLSPHVTYSINLVYQYYVNNRKIRFEWQRVPLKYKLHTETDYRTSCVAHLRDGQLRTELHQFTSNQKEHDFWFDFLGQLPPIRGNGWAPFHRQLPTDFRFQLLIIGIEFLPVEHGKAENSEGKYKLDKQPNINMDTDGEKKLPRDCAEIIKWSKNSMQWSTDKELYFLLRKGFLIKANNEQWFSISKSMKKRPMLPASTVLKGPKWMSLLGRKNWTWKSLPESRFQLVADFGEMESFDIECEIESRFLSPETTYACYLVYKLPTKLHSMFKGMVQIHNQNWQDLGLQLVDLLAPTHVPYIRNVDESLRTCQIKGHPKLRKDGWMEIQIWDISPSIKLRAIRMRSCIKSYEGNFRGLLVQGIEYRPAKVTFML